MVQKKKKKKKGAGVNEDGYKIIARNRRARHDYHILDTAEAGIVLVGTEVKSVRDAKVQVVDSHVEVLHGELWLVNMHIAEYTHGNRYNHEPTRRRKLLMHKQEIVRLRRKVEEKGLTIIPLSVYMKRGRVKVEIAVVRGKKMYDKRHAIRDREVNRDLRRRLQGD